MFADRHRAVFEGVETVRRLWRGEPVPFRDHTGADRETRTMPRPVQAELPVWVTAAGDPDTFRAAGRIGANVLTHLLGQTVEEVEQKIRIYREAWREHEHGPGDGHVTLMVHTFVGADDEVVRDLVRGPMRSYVDSSLSLISGAADTWAAFKRGRDGSPTSSDPEIVALDPNQRADLLEFSTERFIDIGGLFGTPDTCADMIARLRGAGIDEVACLIDFGLPTDVVLDSLGHLDELRKRTQGTGRVPDNDRVGRIADLLVEHSITHLQCVPSMARALVEGDSTRISLGELDVLLVGGERFAADLATRLRSASSASIYNMYGPTETTVYSSTEPIDDQGGDPSIGRPILNTTFHILDEHQRPVPDGEEGELWIGGHGVARGYIGRPDLTSERFIPDPFDDRGGRRLYRTGDLVRRRPDGRFDIIGRTDHQVKIRGNRIELGEIETLLYQHGSVRDVAVLAIDVSLRDRRLVGFVTSRDDAQLDVDALRTGLAATLPDYMVPSRIVAIDEMPLTPNGKVDRKALIDAGWNTRRQVGPISRPIGSTEETIADIWEQVLSTGPVGAHDNFFDLGGHSLIAIEAHNLLERALGRKIAITDLLRYPTVRLLADQLGTPATEARRTDDTIERPAGSGTPLSFAQERLWVIDQLEPGSAAYHDAFTIDIDGPVDVDTLSRGLDVLVERHEILRTAFAVRDGCPTQVVAPSTELHLSVLDLSHESPSQRPLRLTQHTDRLVDLPFDLASGPLLRASLVRLGEQNHVLVLVFHHAIIDGASVAVLLEELVCAYGALQRGESHGMTPITAHYRDFAVRQRRAVESADPSDALAFWGTYLEDVDRPPSASAMARTQLDHRAGRCSLTLDRPTTASLRRLARRADATPFMVFLALFGTQLHRMTLADRVVIGSPFVERGAFGSDAEVGPFLNVLPLRVELAGDPTFQ
jgi:non-ribosomal peptide synthetase component F/acyl carrier protein